MNVARLFVCLLAVYAIAGAIFGVGFAARGVDRVDPTSKTPGFRLIIFPGVVALWPLMLSKWLGG
jgi:hypothetical protein